MPPRLDGSTIAAPRVDMWGCVSAASAQRTRDRHVGAQLGSDSETKGRAAAGWMQRCVDEAERRAIARHRRARELETVIVDAMRRADAMRRLDAALLRALPGADQ